MPDPLGYDPVSTFNRLNVDTSKSEEHVMQHIRSLMLLVLIVVLVLLVVVTEVVSQAADVRVEEGAEYVSVLKGRAVGATIVDREELGTSVVQLQFLTVTHYGSQAWQFVRGDGRMMNNILTAWDATPLLQVDGADWCQTLDQVVPDDLEFGAMWLVVAVWRNVGQEIQHVLPYSEANEQALLDQHQSSIRELELRTATSPISMHTMKCRSLKAHLVHHQNLIAEVHHWREGNGVDVLVVEFRNELQPAAEATLAYAQQKGSEWLDILQQRLDQTPQSSPDERTHIRTMIDLVEQELVKLETIVEECLALDPYELVND